MKYISKPWGSEEVIEKNDQYMVKKLKMYQGHRCSLQYHINKTETIYVLSGILKIYTGKNKISLDEKLYYPNDSITIKAGLIHRMEAMEESIYLEASTPEIEDVVRISDDYERNNS